MTVGLNTSPLNTKAFQAFQQSVPKVSDNNAGQGQKQHAYTTQQQGEKEDNTIKYLTGIGIAALAAIAATAGLMSKKKPVSVEQIAGPLAIREQNALSVVKKPLKLDADKLKEKINLAKKIENLENWLRYVKEYPERAMEKGSPECIAKIEKRIARMREAFARM